MAILVVKSPSGPMLAKPPMEPHWEDLTWSWAWSTGHIASDQKLEPAAKAAWPYALLCAWTYLRDGDEAHDLMEHAVHNAGEYFVRHPDSTEQKLTARIRSVVRRRAKQLAHQQRRETERIDGKLTTLSVESFSFDKRSEFCCGGRNRLILISDVDRTIPLQEEMDSIPKSHANHGKAFGWVGRY